VISTEVINVTTADRIDPAGYRAWAPPAVAVGDAAEDEYVGKHRRPGGRGFSLRRMFYAARHLRRY
jgi:hypothetical protein